MRILNANGASPKVLEMLSVVDESLLKYESARRWLSQKCKLLGKTSKKDRKRLALLTQARKQKETLPSKAIARELLAFLSTEYSHTEAIHDCKSLAREWLVGNVNSIAIIDELLEHFAQQGLTTDQEIYRYLQDKT